MDYLFSFPPKPLSKEERERAKVLMLKAKEIAKKRKVTFIIPKSKG